jgi:hypothetical protein
MNDDARFRRTDTLFRLLARAIAHGDHAAEILLRQRIRHERIG